MPGFGFSLGIGLGARRSIPAAPAAAPYASVATEQDVMDWIAATGGGASGARPKWPGAATANNGMYALLGNGLGVEGVDFSRNAALPDPVDASTLPGWDAAFKRLLFQNSTTGANRSRSNMIVNGVIDCSVTNGNPVVIEDTIIDDTARGLPSYYTASHHPNGNGDFILRRCRMKGLATGALVTLKRGEVSDCYLGNVNKGDGIRLGTMQPKLFLRNLVHAIGVEPNWHGDIVQTDEMPGNVVSFGNVYYMPYSGGPFDEGTTGTTNVLNYNNGGNDPVSDFLNVNDALIGGGYCVNLAPDAGKVTGSFALVGCWFSKKGGGYNLFGDFYPYNAGTCANILIHNCRHIEDGSPATRLEADFQWRDASGLWDYDKASASARFRQVCRMLGYTDWNDDPLVTVRTGFHAF